jgi:ammonia channel protein AmtB
LFGEQLRAVGVVMVFSFVVSLIIGVALEKVLRQGIRVSAEDEARPRSDAALRAGLRARAGLTTEVEQ